MMNDSKLIPNIQRTKRIKFNLLMGDMGVFDFRICQLPSKKYVVDYFRWRNEDANRNALNTHCNWSLRKQGDSPQEADGKLSRLSVAEKNEFLFQQGTNFNDIPNWQKRGMGVYWESYEKEAINPLTNEPVKAQRNRLKVDFDLPMKEQYSEFIKGIIENEKISRGKQ